MILGCGMGEELSAALGNWEIALQEVPTAQDFKMVNNA